MLCDECKKRPASVHLTKMVNNKKFEKNLCQQCASEMGEGDLTHESKYSIHNLLAGLLNFDPHLGTLAKNPYTSTIICDNCGLSYGEFSRKGRLGCPACYTHFAQHLDPLLRRIQGSNQHGGKVPTRTGGTLKLKNKIQQLRQELQRYISHEEFERAAQVRDQIKELEKELGMKGVE
jgi:protein arginine kinase activator